MNSTQFTELLLQSLEHERGGVHVYLTAIKCAVRDDLRSEWQRYLAQTEEHVESLTDVCDAFDIDPFTTTPGTQIVKSLGKALVTAMETALSAGNPHAAQIVAAECVVLAETKDHLDWELIGEAAKELSGDQRDIVLEAYDGSRTKRTNISITRRAGAASCGWSRWASKHSCRPRKKSRM